MNFFEISFMRTYLRTISFFFLVGSSIILASCDKKQNSSSQNAAQERKLSSLPVIKVLPEFSGTNAEKTTFQSKDLRGSVWVAYFFFTSCGGPCPVMNQRVAEIQQEFFSKDSNIASNLTFVGISVDPETDTPETMTAYGQRYNRNPARWRMVNIPEDSLRIVAAQGFMLGSPEDPSLHSTRFAIIDKQGQLRGFYDGMDETELVKLKSAIKELVQE